MYDGHSKKKKVEDEIESIKYGPGLKYLLNTVF